MADQQVLQTADGQQWQPYPGSSIPNTWQHLPDDGNVYFYDPTTRTMIRAFSGLVVPGTNNGGEGTSGNSGPLIPGTQGTSVRPIGGQGATLWEFLLALFFLYLIMRYTKNGWYVGVFVLFFLAINSDAVSSGLKGFLDFIQTGGGIAPLQGA